MKYECKQMTCWNIEIKLLMHLKMNFLSEYFKKSYDAGYNYVLKDVKKFIHEIKSMEKKLI